MMKKSITLLSFSLCLLVFRQGNAQNKINGTVTDGRSGDRLAGVSVIEKGTNNGTLTDENGEYAIEVSEEGTLTFSYIGYVSVEKRINAAGTINVSLEKNALELSELVVTSLGFRESNDDLGYATSTIKGEDVAKAPEATLINSLAGRASGLSISKNSGDPGAGAYIQVRGVSSITRNSQPLIVIDGVPVSNDVRDNGDGRIAQQSRLNDINPNDIEDVTVLKGASAAALWGTKALGGVIMITTKSGKYNQKLKISFNTSYSIDEISEKYPLQTQFGRGNKGVFSNSSRDSWGDRIADRLGGSNLYDLNGERFVDQNGRTWLPILQKNSKDVFDQSNFDEIFQNGHTWKKDISLSVGDENSKAFFSLSDMNQNGIVKHNSDYRRTTIRFNGEHKFSKKLKVSNDFYYAKTSQDRIRRGASSSGLYLGLLRTPPDFDNSGYRGDYYASPDASPISNRQRSYRTPLGESESAIYNNPLWTINEQENKAIVNRFIDKLELTYSPVDWIDLIGRVGIDFYSEKKDQLMTPGAASGAYKEGAFNSSLAINSIFNMDYIAKATHSLGSHIDGTLLIGFNYNAKKRVTQGADISDFIQFTDVASTTRDINNALPENTSVSGTFGQERTAAVYTSATFNIYEMLIVNATLRSEAASTFGNNAKSNFIFPSASVAWQFSRLIDSDILSFGKLRFSYGEVGVQPARYKISNQFVSSRLSDPFAGNLDMGLFGKGGLVPSVSRGNPNLKPERKKETEIGTDLRFFHDKLSFSGTYYQNKTIDILLDLPIANSRGYDIVYSNGGELQNKGWEFDVGYHLMRTKDLNWDIHFIYSKVKNKVTNLVGTKSINLGGLAAVNSRAVEGYPFGVLWGSRILRDDNGETQFDANGFPIKDEQEGVIGDPNPEWEGAVATDISYKGITLSVLFSTLQGADIYAGTEAVLYSLGRSVGSANESVATQDLKEFDGNIITKGTSFRGNIKDFGAGPVALTEAWYTSEGGYFGGGNTEFYIQDGSWTRLKELSLSYTLNQPWLNTIGIRSARLSLTGRNLFIWSPFKGNDPNTSLNGVSVAKGLEYFNNPGTKSYVVSLNINF